MTPDEQADRLAMRLGWSAIVGGLLWLGVLWMLWWPW
jgi:hypothetical protein